MAGGLDGRARRGDSPINATMGVLGMSGPMARYDRTSQTRNSCVATGSDHSRQTGSDGEIGMEMVVTFIEIEKHSLGKEFDQQ